MLLKDKFIFLCKIKKTKKKQKKEKAKLEMSQVDEENDLSVRSLSFSLSPLSTRPSLSVRCECVSEIFLLIQNIWQLWPFFVTLDGNLLQLLNFSKGYEKNALMQWDKEPFLEPVIVISFQNCLTMFSIAIWPFIGIALLSRTSVDASLFDQLIG